MLFYNAIYVKLVGGWFSFLVLHYGYKILRNFPFYCLISPSLHSNCPGLMSLQSHTWNNDLQGPNTINAST